MSLKNIIKVRQLTIQPAALKHLLMTFASYADAKGHFECPTANAICRDTGMDRKTVYKYKTRLKQMGLIQSIESSDRKMVMPGGKP